MATPDNSAGQRAANHERRARNYRRQALLLLEQDGDTDCAGSLIYESSKQCINALANLEGTNPGSTGAKERFLLDLAQRTDSPPNLDLRWRAAGQLHIHADRGHLSDEEFIARWDQALLFIEGMLLIYASGQQQA